MTGRLTASRAREIVASRGFRLTIRIVVGGGVLVAVVARVGTGPFVHGLLSLDAPAIGAAIVFAAIATAAAAWRWQLIARRLGVALRWSTAVKMYYQSQFLNTVLPGGVVGDVQRAVDHGRNADSVAKAARAVVVERTVGQVVQLGLTVVVLAFFGAEYEGFLFPVIGIGLAALAVGALAATVASARFRRALRHEVVEVRAGLGSPAVSAQVVGASIVVVACHVATFAVATTAVGVNVPPVQVVTLAIVVLLAASIPLNVGGWGPREGVAGWAFAVAGFGASAGVSAATLFGVLAIISIVPGVIVTRLASVSSRRNHRDRPTVRDVELRHLPRWVPRHRAPAEARTLERSGLRSGR
ncbi:lysylphosphatidylglycerol synthase transmembrane domain-containing protein [Leifsonia poae]|uniref:lysylphosphatidylglycerol synthase transmembrane domain-containing protein n=1 Tax=Leifsonia poae TaxID=110933 RepID=UPI003D667799